MPKKIKKKQEEKPVEVVDVLLKIHNTLEKMLALREKGSGTTGEEQLELKKSMGN